MKICVVDDEREVRLSIIHKLQLLFPEVDIFDVEFGQIALEHIQMVRPDLVFIDIRMPQIDGLDILRSIHTTNPAILFVILSGYDDFEYARQALQLGAIDYILKPADREQLRNIVDKVTREMEAMFRKELEVYLNKLSDQYVFIHDIQCFNTSLWFDERQIKQIYIEKSELLLKQWEKKPKQILFSFRVNHDYAGIVVGADSDHQEFSFHIKVQLLPELIAAIERWESQRFFEGKRDLPVSTPLTTYHRNAGKSAALLRRDILYAAKAGNFDQLRGSLNLWMDFLESLEFSQLKKECVDLMALLDEGLSTNEIIVLEEEKIHYWWKWVSKHQTWSELKGKIQKFVLEGVYALKQLENPASLSWFEQALQLVNTSRDPNLNLESVADLVGVHPVTLSRVFKQQTGVNFVRYIVRRRLRGSQTLLLHTDKKINEISEEIGYSDFRYFRQLFKKEFGLSPSEYRRGNGMITTNDEAE